MIELFLIVIPWRMLVEIVWLSQWKVVLLCLFYKLDGKTYQHHIKVGFSVDKIQPYTQEPKDFDAFWQQAKDELKNVPLSYTKDLAKEYCTDKIDCYLVKLQIDKMGHAMYGYLFYPKNAKQGSHPVVLTYITKLFLLSQQLQYVDIHLLKCEGIFIDVASHHLQQE